jgi:hypothetical protein
VPTLPWPKSLNIIGVSSDPFSIVWKRRKAKALESVKTVFFDRRGTFTRRRHQILG